MQAASKSSQGWGVIMAAESDVLQNISNADIIKRMTITSSSLRSQLLL